ncbi:MAG: PD-(D/E)XK nuclease family protein [Longimicrobiaceae bacterium]
MPQATWSASRDATLDVCERKYYYQYLISDAPELEELRREIRRLKQLKSLEMWQGECFHQAAADLVRKAKRRKGLGTDEIVSRVESGMRATWTKEQAARALPGELADRPLFFEHEYGLEFPSDALELSVARVRVWLDRLAAWFANEGVEERIASAKRIWVEPSMFAEDAPGLRLKHVRLLAKVDLALVTPADSFEIFDWKTGVPPASGIRESNECQIRVYQLWPHVQLHYPVERIRASLVYVAADPLVSNDYGLDWNERDVALRRIWQSIQRGEYLERVAAAEGSTAADFDMANHPALCRQCAFKRICQRGIHGS